jgi:membrane protein
MAGSLVVSIAGATSVVSTLMEGFRRAYELPEEKSMWAVRMRALLLVPFSLVPFAVASAIVVFGNLVTLWLAHHLAMGIRGAVLVAALVVRWSVAIAGCVGILAVVYHMGTPTERWHVQDPGEQPWRRVVPGAGMATLLWFLVTITFGWYVTRFANYSRVYGSLGAGIALLIWLYIVALCVLYGAEFNAQLFFYKNGGAGRKAAEIASKMAVTSGDAS